MDDEEGEKEKSEHSFIKNQIKNIIIYYDEFQATDYLHVYCKSKR